jgi:cell wall-associated NlpC family hydrolase
VKGVGVDCGGLLYQVYNPFFGPFRPFPKDYPPDWALHRENEMYLAFIRPYTIPVRHAIPGGIAVFQVGRNFSHGTICTEEGTFIHAWGRNQSGSVVESRLNFFSIGGKRRKVQYFDVVK